MAKTGDNVKKNEIIDFSEQTINIVKENTIVNFQNQAGTVTVNVTGGETGYELKIVCFGNDPMTLRLGTGFYADNMDLTLNDSVDYIIRFVFFNNVWHLDTKTSVGT